MLLVLFSLVRLFIVSTVNPLFVVVASFEDVVPVHGVRTRGDLREIGSIEHANVLNQTTLSDQMADSAFAWLCAICIEGSDPSGVEGPARIMQQLDAAPGIVLLKQLACNMTAMVGDEHQV